MELTLAARFVHACRGVLMVAAIAIIVLCWPDQTLDVYRGLADGALAGQWQWVGACLSIALTALWMTALSRSINFRIKNNRSSRADRSSSRISMISAPLLIAGFAVGTFRSAGQYDANFMNVDPQLAAFLASDASRLTDSVARSSSALLLVACLAALVTIFLVAYAARQPFQTNSAHSLPRLGFNKNEVAIAIFLTVLASIAVALNPAGFIERLGAIPMWCLFSIPLSYFLCGLFLLKDEKKIPALSIVLIVAASLSFLGLNDNHVIVFQENKTGVIRTSSADTFREWLSERKNCPSSNALRQFAA